MDTTAPIRQSPRKAVVEKRLINSVNENAPPPVPDPAASKGGGLSLKAGQKRPAILHARGGTDAAMAAAAAAAPAVAKRPLGPNAASRGSSFRTAEEKAAQVKANKAALAAKTSEPRAPKAVTSSSFKSSAVGKTAVSKPPKVSAVGYGARGGPAAAKSAAADAAAAAEASAAAKAAAAELVSLRGDVDSLRGEVGALQAANEAAGAEVAAGAEARAALEAQLQVGAEARAALQAKVQSLGASNEELSCRCAAGEATLAESRAEVSHLEGTTADQAAAIVGLEVEVARLKEEALRADALRRALHNQVRCQKERGLGPGEDGGISHLNRGFLLSFPCMARRMPLFWLGRIDLFSPYLLTSHFFALLHALRDSGSGSQGKHPGFLPRAAPAGR